MRSGTSGCFGEEKESPGFLGERRKWYFLREVCFDPGVCLTQLGGVYTWKGGTGDRSYGFCIQSPGNGEVPGERRWYFFLGREEGVRKGKQTWLRQTREKSLRATRGSSRSIYGGKGLNSLDVSLIRFTSM